MDDGIIDEPTKGSPRPFNEPVRGPEALENFYGRYSQDHGSSRHRLHNSISASHLADSRRGSLSAESSSNRDLTDQEAEDDWSDAREKPLKYYNFSSAAAAASKSSLMQRPSLPTFSPPSPRPRTSSTSDSPILSSPLTPSSSSNGLSASHRRNTSGTRKYSIGIPGVNPTGMDDLAAMPPPSIANKVSWSAQSSSSRLGSSRKASSHSIDAPRLPRSGSASGLSKSVVRPHASAETGWSSVISFTNKSTSEVGQSSYDRGSAPKGKMYGLGLGAALGDADISEFERGKGFGYTPGKDRQGSSDGRNLLRGPASSLFSKSGGHRASDANLPREPSHASARMSSSLRQPSRELVAVSIADEMQSEEEPAAKTSSTFSLFGKAFRRKNKSSVSESKPAAAPKSASRTPSGQQVRRMPSQVHPMPPSRASVEKAPLIVLSSKAIVPPELPTNNTKAIEDFRRQTLDEGRPSVIDKYERPSPQEVLPRKSSAAEVLPNKRFQPHESGDEDEADDQDDGRGLVTPQPLDPETPGLDATPVPGRSPAAPTTPLAKANGIKHKPQSSMDSTSSGARRRSLAFLASAISMGAIVDAAGQDKGVETEASPASSSSRRPNTALGTVSPSASASSEARPSLSSIPATVSRSGSGSSLSHAHTYKTAESIPVRNLAMPKLVAKSATKDDEIPSVLSEFVKMDALESQKLQLRNDKSPAAAYAAANRDPSPEPAPKTPKPKTRRLSEDEVAAESSKGGGMASLFRPTSNKSTGATLDGKKFTLSTSPKNARTPMRGTYMAAPAGPSMGGFASPFYVAPLTSVDSGLATRATGRRASASSRSIASDDSRSAKSGLASARRGSASQSSVVAAQAQAKEKEKEAEAINKARKAKSHSNLRSAAREAEAEKPSRASMAERRNDPALAFSSIEGLTPSSEKRIASDSKASAKLTRSASRLKSVSSSATFSQRFFRRPRTGGTDIPNALGSNLRVDTSREFRDGAISPTTKPIGLVASPTDSIEFEFLTPRAEPSNGRNLSVSSAAAGRASADNARSPDAQVVRRSSRGRSNSLASLDTMVEAPGGRHSRDATLQARSERQLSESPDTRSRSNSRLESNGGAAGLFGGGAPRQRTSSLLPSFAFGRNRTGSSAGIESKLSSGVEGLPAQGLEAESASQTALRKKPSFRGLSSRKVCASAANDQPAAATGIVLGKSDSVGPDSGRGSLEDAKSNGRRSMSSNRPSTSSRPSFSRQMSGPADAQKAAKFSMKEFLPWDDEEPEKYAERIGETAPKTQIAAILASSSDPFYMDALKHHMTRFWFNGNPLDIALRKLLMDLHLPKETQQIDRVMEAFAKRYNECNDNLYASDDQPYILAFSLMMLHTDAFNKNAKHKMTKADYLRNTGPSGVPTEILEYLFDNLTFTQFIYVEDEEDLQKRALEASSAAGSAAGSMVLSAAGQMGKAKIDPYYLISQGRLGEFRADLNQLIPEDTPFSYTGTLAAYDVDRLNAAFLHAPSIEIATGRPAMPTTSGWPGAEAPAQMLLSQGTVGQLSTQDEVVTLKVTKVAVVSRKDDVVDGGRKSASRKWKTSGLMLTGSQLLLFKDIVWTTALQSQILGQVGHSQLSNGINPVNPGGPGFVEGGIIITPRITYFRPDGVISLAGAVAVKDNTYSKYDHVFRLLAAKGRQYLVQAQNEDDMNDWIHKINFCACFRTTNIKIRGLDLAPKFGESGADHHQRRGSQSQMGIPSRKPSVGSDFRNFSSDSSRLANQSSFASFSDVDGARPPSRPMSPDVYDDEEDEQEQLQDDDTGSELSPRSKSRASSRASSMRPMNMLQRRIAARRELMQAKVEETNAELEKVLQDLSEEMRLANHFAILTPFQKATRDRIEMAAMPLSSKIKHLRLEVAKVESRTKILVLDLEAGERVGRHALPLLPSSAISDARKMSGSQLATPQLLELGGISEGQSGFEDFFGTGDTSVGSEGPSFIEAAERARLAQRSRCGSGDHLSPETSRTLNRSSQDGASDAAPPTLSPSSSNSRITKPASQQRNQMNLNAVSEKPADESFVLGGGARLGAMPDDSFQSSCPSDPDLAADSIQEEDEAGKSDQLKVQDATEKGQGRFASPDRSSVSRSSASIDGQRHEASSTKCLPTEADEVPEDWDMSKVVRNGSNRISLVDLPSPGELQEATTRRFIFGVSKSKS